MSPSAGEVLSHFYKDMRHNHSDLQHLHRKAALLVLCEEHWVLAGKTGACFGVVGFHEEDALH